MVARKKLPDFFTWFKEVAQKKKKKSKKKIKFCSYFLIAKFGYIGLQMIAASATSENQKKKNTYVYFFLR